MRLRLILAVLALVACRATWANCMRETLGHVICGQSPCSNYGHGKAFCAAGRYGTALRDELG